MKRNYEDLAAHSKLPNARCFFSMTANCGFLSVVLIGSFFTAGCQSSNAVHFGFAYRAPSRGIGGAGVIDRIVIPPGRESEVVSRSILEAVQNMSLSVVKPNRSELLGRSLPQRTPIVTDYAPMSPEEVQAHNAQFPNLQLPQDRKYDFRLTLEYAVNKESLDFTAAAELRVKAVGGRPRPYTAAYSDQFFVSKLKNQIGRSLARPLPQ